LPALGAGELDRRAENTADMATQLRNAGFTAILVVVMAAAVAGFASGSGGRRVQTVHIVTGTQHLETLDFGAPGTVPAISTCSMRRC
jgi:hypothetical protein